MELKEIDAIGLKVSQGSLNLRKQSFRRTVHYDLPRSRLVDPSLGRDKESFRIRMKSIGN